MRRLGNEYEDVSRSIPVLLRRRSMAIPHHNPPRTCDSLFDLNLVPHASRSGSD